MTTRSTYDPEKLIPTSNTLVTEIDKFLKEHQDLPLNSAKIKKILDLYKHWRACYETFKCKLFPRKILYFVLERMFCSRFDESEYVVLLMRFLLEIEGHLFCVMVPNFDRCPSLWYAGDQDFCEYFLYHAHKQKALFDGYRLPCTEIYDSYSWQHPVQMAASIPDPVLLRHMLRYGALLSYDKNYESADVRRFRYRFSGLLVIISTLSCIVKFNPNLLTMDDLELMPGETEIYMKLLHCCELLLRDFSHSTPNFISAVRFERVMPRKKEVLDFIEIFSANVIPNFKKHFIVPMDLKQACSLVIRRTLNDKWLLPHAIEKLPIPNYLKMYLDLYND